MSVLYGSLLGAPLGFPLGPADIAPGIGNDLAAEALSLLIWQLKGATPDFAWAANASKPGNGLVVVGGSTTPQTYPTPTASNLASDATNLLIWQLRS